MNIMMAVLAMQILSAPTPPDLTVKIETGVPTFLQQGAGGQCALMYEAMINYAYAEYWACVDRNRGHLFSAFALMGCEAAKAASIQAAHNAYASCVGS